MAVGVKFGGEKGFRPGQINMLLHQKKKVTTSITCIIYKPRVGETLI